VGHTRLDQRCGRGCNSRNWGALSSIPHTWGRHFPTSRHMLPPAATPHPPRVPYWRHVASHYPETHIRPSQGYQPRRRGHTSMCQPGLCTNHTAPHTHEPWDPPGPGEVCTPCSTAHGPCNICHPVRGNTLQADTATPCLPTAASTALTRFLFSASTCWCRQLA
jgi:hypothetical protein